MKKTLSGVLFACILATNAGPAQAGMALQKRAKEAGFPAANCQYCHNEKLPAKGKVTQNARGEFLLKQKEAKKAKEVDVAWLKEYVEPKK
jgi:hypothetical protein